jgi:hypothetical protein
MPVVAPVAAPAIPSIPWGPSTPGAANNVVPFRPGPSTPASTPFLPNWSEPGPLGVPRSAPPTAPAVPGGGLGGLARGLGNLGLAIGAGQLGWNIGDAIRRKGVDDGWLDPEESLYDWEKAERNRLNRPIAPKKNVVPPTKAAPFTGGQCLGPYMVEVLFDSYGTSYNWSTGAGSQYLSSKDGGFGGELPGPIGAVSKVFRGDSFDLYDNPRPFYRLQLTYGPDRLIQPISGWTWDHMVGTSIQNIRQKVSRLPAGTPDTCGNPQSEPDPTYSPPRTQPKSPVPTLPPLPKFPKAPVNPKAPAPTAPPQRQPSAPPATKPKAPPTTAPPQPEAPPRLKPVNPVPAPPTRAPETPRAPQPAPQPEPAKAPPKAPPTTKAPECDPCDVLGQILDLLQPKPPKTPEADDCNVCDELAAIKKNTVDIKDKADVIDGKADEIKTALETEMIAATAVACERQLVGGKQQWVPVSHSIQVRVLKRASEGFRAQLVQTAELAKVACNARNDVPDPLDCNICDELAIIKATTSSIQVDTGIIRPTANAIFEDTTAIKVDTVAIKGKVDAVKVDTEAIKGKVDAVKVDTEAIKVKADAIKVDTGAIKVKADAIKIDTEYIRVSADAIQQTTNSIQADTGVIRPTANAIFEDTALIRSTTNLIKTDTATIRVAVESRMVSAPVVRCEQRTVNGVTSWVSVTEQRQFSVFKEAADGFEQQLKEVAKLTEAECKGRNDKDKIPDCVAIMPSDIYSEFNIEGRLTLYFVKEADWPKRGANDSKWSIDIPNPIDGLDWCTHFENFAYTKGNFNCREFWSDSGIRSGAYCSSKNEGIRLLNMMKALTKATSLRRRFSEVSVGRKPLYQGRIRVIRAVKTTIVNGTVTACVAYHRPATGCQ